MKIKTVVVGDLLTNCYIVEKGDKCIIIDPGAEAEKIISNIDSTKKVIGIFITSISINTIGNWVLSFSYNDTCFV